jgi:hypothetical protein
LRRHQKTDPKGTSQVKASALRSRVHVRAKARGLVSMSGLQLLAETARVSGLDEGLSVALAPWRKARAVHDPGKVVLDLAFTLAAGGDCPADSALLRAGADLFGPVASAPTICRVVDALAADLDASLVALRSARAEARAWVGELCDRGRTPEQRAAAVAAEVIVDLDATLVTAHSEKQDAAPTYKRGFGHHPLTAYLDHGPDGTGEGLAALLRPGNANAGTAADHLRVLDLVEEQLTEAERARLVVRTDTAACTHAFLDELVERGYGYSVGFYARAEVAAAIEALPAQAWVAALDAEAELREGAWVAEIGHLLSLAENGWPAGIRVIARKERPHPGAQLRLTDVEGHRVTCFATNAAGTDLAALELRHRRRARVEDRIRAAKDTGLNNLPYHDTASNQIWCELVLLAQDLLAWLQMLGLQGEHAVAEPKRLRLHLFAVAGRLVRSARRTTLDLDADWPWTATVLNALQRLRALPAPA